MGWIAGVHFAAPGPFFTRVKTRQHKIRVLVCDDSAPMRSLIGRVLEPEPDIEVAGKVENGRVALDSIRRSRPDLLLLDLQMPVLDGLGTLRELRRFDRRLPVIVFSGQGRDVGSATLDALASGAQDYVEKPVGRNLRAALESVRAELVPRIRALAGAPSSGAQPVRPLARSTRAPANVAPRSVVRALAIGSSTGGPQALMELVPKLGAPFPVPILITQHMGDRFTGLLIKRLSELSGMPGGEGRDGELIKAGRIYLAPGGKHMTVRRGRISLDSGPRVHNCRPAVDPLFFSAAREYRSGLLAVVLTGMGQDGGPGAVAVRGAGGVVLAQDRESSVVYGMPRAVVEAGAASKVLPLSRIAGEIRSRVGLLDRAAV